MARAWGELGPPTPPLFTQGWGGGLRHVYAALGHHKLSGSPLVLRSSPHRWTKHVRSLPHLPAACLGSPIPIHTPNCSLSHRHAELSPETPELSLPHMGAPLPVAFSMPGPLPAVPFPLRSAWQSPHISHDAGHTTLLPSPQVAVPLDSIKGFIISLPPIHLPRYSVSS